MIGVNKAKEHKNKEIWKRIKTNEMKAIKKIPSKANPEEKNVKGYQKKEAKKVIYIWENNLYVI